MKGIQIFKHSLTVVLTISLTLGLIQLFNLEVTDKELGSDIISGVFFLALFAVLSVYRIDWVSRRKPNWISSLLLIVNLIGLLLMFIEPKNILAFWKPTAAVFILLTNYTYYSKITGKNWSGSIAKFFLLITTCLFLYPLFINTGNQLYYSFVWLFFLATTIFAIAHIFIPEKNA